MNQQNVFIWCTHDLDLGCNRPCHPRRPGPGRLAGRGPAAVGQAADLVEESAALFVSVHHLSKECEAAVNKKNCNTCKWLGIERYPLRVDHLCRYPIDRVPYAYRRDHMSPIVEWKKPWVNNPKQWGKNCPTWQLK